MRVKIVRKQTGGAFPEQSVVNSETGEEIEHVMSLRLRMDRTGCSAELEVYEPDLDLEDVRVTELIKQDFKGHRVTIQFNEAANNARSNVQRDT